MDQNLVRNRAQRLTIDERKITDWMTRLGVRILDELREYMLGE